MRILYLNPNNSQKEQAYFEVFLSAMGEISIDKWEKGEAPDYVLYISGKRIGLELTTLVLSEELAAIRAAQNDCLRRGAELATRCSMDAVEVGVQFRSDYDRIDAAATAEELVEFVKQKIAKIDDSKTWHFYESGLKHVKWVHIQLGTVNGQRWLFVHRFGRIHMNWMRVDPVEEIQARIDEKQRKFQNYTRRCDECWLLIGVDEWTAPEAVAITEQLETHSFSGDFQRLFFLRNIEGKLKELRIVPASAI